MTLQHKGIDTPHLVGERTQGDGTGDVGCAVKILGAAVEQQQAFGLEGDVGVRGGLIVHDGSMLLIGSDGVEGDAAEEGLFGAEALEFGGEGEFGDRGRRYRGRGGTGVRGCEITFIL